MGAGKGKITKEDIQDPQYERHVSIGFNYRMSEPCCAIALGQLERLELLVAQTMSGRPIRGSHRRLRLADPSGGSRRIRILVLDFRCSTEPSSNLLGDFRNK